MKIELINQNKFDILKEIYETYPILTLQNIGYETINCSKFNEEEKQAYNTVTNILKEHIKGFNEFNNFRLTNNNEIQIRLQYDWNYVGGKFLFIGVGYILLKELLEGFTEFRNCEIPEKKPDYLT